MNIILEDSRQQRGKHDNINSWLVSHGVEIRRTKLYVGDYTLPADQSTCIDSKYGLQEVYNNVIQGHERFVRECKAAHEAGIKLIILVEQRGINSLQDVPNWNNPRYTKWVKLRDAHRQGKRMNEPLSPYPPVNSERLARAMQTISERYHIEWRFCDKRCTAKVICDILGIEVDNKELHAYWIPSEYGCKCSMCKKEFLAEDAAKLYECPNCKSQMGEPRKEADNA